MWPAPALSGLLAAVLFGISTPLAKLLLGDMPPTLLAGVLYLGSGVGLAIVLAARRRRTGDASGLGIPRGGWPALLLAIAFGGVAGPLLLLTGLTRTDAATASLLLNLESVFTAVIAWRVFKENTDRRVVAGLAAIVAGGVVLSWAPGSGSVTTGAVLIAAACLCWAIDNNLTREVASGDAIALTCLKGLVAGTVNTAAALLMGASLPSLPVLGLAALLGFVSYGLSLALFVVALRTIGTSRAGAYFSVAPLFGVALSMLLWPALPGIAFWVAAGLMALGVWLHLTERHAHTHTHEVLDHAHPHEHDAHHQHPHPPGTVVTGPHTHPHRHEALTHRHPHYPDIHHRHPH